MERKNKIKSKDNKLKKIYDFVFWLKPNYR